MRSYRLLSSLACASIALAQSAPAPPPPGPAISMSVQGVSTASDPRIKDVIVGGFQPAAAPGGQPIPVRAFTPETVTAAPGDTIRFTFLGGNHAVVQATADQPCTPAPGGFASGPQPNPNNDLSNAPKMNFQVPDTPGPIYLSTMDTGNCGQGMVMTVNPPPEGQPGAHAAFKQKAITQGNPGLQPAGGLVAQAAVAQAPASTISIQVAGLGTPGAQVQGPPGTVVQGQGRTGNGQACSCQCLCGGAVAAAGSVAQGNFGGIVGSLPAIGAMSAPPMQQVARVLHGNYKPPLY